jgi:uroporphyrinogen-III decarboxylase
MMGIEMFSYALIDAFDDAARLVEGYFRHALDRAQAFAQTSVCPLFMYGDDIAFKGRAMFSPSVMHKLFYPYLEELCHVLGQSGIKVIFHTDGYVMDIAADLVACGIAGLNPLEPLAGNDIPELKRLYGDRLILVGGIDCSQILPLGTVDDVRAAVRDLLDTCGRGGGLFIGSSSEIVPVTPVENIHAFYDACREFGQYPLDL